MNLTVYACKEPSTDELLQKCATNAKKFDVVIYADKKAKHKKCVFRWDLSSKPTRRNKFITINCF